MPRCHLIKRKFRTKINFAPNHTNGFLKVSVFVSTKMKQNIYGQASVFVSFLPIDANLFSFKSAYFFMPFCLLSTLTHPKTLMETTTYDAFFSVPLSKEPPLSHIHTRNRVLETMHFQKAPLLKPFSKPFIFISVVNHFSVDDWQTCIKQYTFSNENYVLSWLGSFSHTYIVCFPN